MTYGCGVEKTWNIVILENAEGGLLYLIKTYGFSCANMLRYVTD